MSAPGWSPDGRTMAFVRVSLPSARTTVVLVNADGTGERVLATSREKEFFVNTFVRWGTNRPGWSMDGKLLALGAALESTTLQRSGVIILDVSTGAEMRRLVAPPGGLVWEVSWLDLTRLLLNGSDGLLAPQGLWSLDLNDETWRPLTPESMAFHWCSFSGDRRTALATRTNVRSNLWLSGTTGEDARVLLSDMTGMPGPIAVDDTGAVVYAARSSPSEQGLYRLAAGAWRPQLLRNTVADFIAVTSDGQSIVFSGGFPTEPLYRIDAKGTGLTKLVDRNAGGPSVSRDGATVFFSPYNQPGLFAVPTMGGSVRQLSSLRWLHC
jgi:hypothetical protein